MFRAWSAGAGIIILGYAAWVVVLLAGKYFIALLSQDFVALLGAAFIFLLSSSPFVAALVAAYFAPRKHFLLGISMVLPTTILAVMLNFVYQWLGYAGDFSGIKGGLTLFKIMLVYSGIYCGLGSIVGLILAKEFRNKVEPT